jgi:hypothetical protein
MKIEIEPDAFLPLFAFICFMILCCTIGAVASIIRAIINLF